MMAPNLNRRPLRRLCGGMRDRLCVALAVLGVAASSVQVANADFQILWSNRDSSGLSSDTSQVVDAAIWHWQRVLIDTGTTTPHQFVLNVAQQATPSIGQALDFAEDGNGLPIAASLRIDDGTFVNGLGGFFVDPTPYENSEFAHSAVPHYGAAVDSNAIGRIDLLTVLVHELGHALGFFGDGVGTYSRWSAAHEGTTELFYDGGSSATLFNATVDGLAHIRNLPSQPLDLMATAGDLPSGGVSDRRLPGALDLDILAGIYGFGIDPAALVAVPEPTTGVLLGVAAFLIRAKRRRHCDVRRISQRE